MAPPSCVTLIGQSTSGLNCVNQLESKITAVYRDGGPNSASLIDLQIKVNVKNIFFENHNPRHEN